MRLLLEQRSKNKVWWHCVGIIIICQFYLFFIHFNSQMGSKLVAIACFFLM